MPTLEQTKTRKKLKLQKPPVYCIVFYNNEKTPIDIVIYLLIIIFKYSQQEAEKITLDIHKAKQAPVFINSKEVCDMKYSLLKKTCAFLNEQFLEFDVKLYDGESNGNQ